MYTLDVKDSKEYADKMRQLTPGTKEAMQHGFLGTAVHSFKSSTIEWLETKDSFRRFKRVMRAGLLSSCLSLVAMLCSCARLLCAHLLCLSAMCAPIKTEYRRSLSYAERVPSLSYDDRVPPLHIYRRYKSTTMPHSPPPFFYS
jgi:hypothetical protein